MRWVIRMNGMYRCESCHRCIWAVRCCKRQGGAGCEYLCDNRSLLPLVSGVFMVEWPIYNGKKKGRGISFLKKNPPFIKECSCSPHNGTALVLVETALASRQCGCLLTVPMSGSSVQVVDVYAYAQILLFDIYKKSRQKYSVLARMCWASRLPTAPSTKQGSVYVLSVVASNGNQRIYIFEETREEQRTDWYFLEDRGVCVIVLGNQT